MKIFDCFMYMNEDVILDLRLKNRNSYCNTQGTIKPKRDAKIHQKL